MSSVKPSRSSRVITLSISKLAISRCIVLRRMSFAITPEDSLFLLNVLADELFHITFLPLRKHVLKQLPVAFGYVAHMSSARQTGFPFAFHSIWFSPAGVGERLSLAFEIGLEWVVCHKTGLSTTFNWIPSTMPGKRKIKPQVEGLSIFEKGGHGWPHRVKRSR